MSRVPQPFVVHHHGFKCAGSTLVHLLHRAWRGRVLHIEHRVPDRRITCAHVAPHVDGNLAVTSHLLSLPEPGQELGLIHVALLRDPLDRLVSAFDFVDDGRREAGFLEFVSGQLQFGNDYQVQQLDPQAGAATAARVRLDDPRVLIGLVERFDDTMFVLEQRLARHGCMFDASVGRPQNVGQRRTAEPRALDALDAAQLEALRAANARDYELHTLAGAALDRELQQIDPDGTGRRLYEARCAVRAEFTEAYLGASAESWTYVDDDPTP